MPPAKAMALGDAERLREEDPFTGQAVVGVPTHIVVHRSRFEFDLNRETSDAVYCTPEQCWGLDVWHDEPGEDLVDGSLAIHAAYYRMLGGMLDDIATERALRSPRRPQLQSSPDGARPPGNATGRGAGHQHRHIFHAAR